MAAERAAVQRARDVWAGTVCQNPMVPVMTMHDVPKKFQLAVSELRQLETNEASVVLASLASVKIEDSPEPLRRRRPGLLSHPALGAELGAALHRD